jgi:hypothetical protein
MKSNSIISLVSLVFIGLLFVAAESSAQGVPPRSQTLQLIRPITRPPVPPLEREVTDIKKELRPMTGAQGVVPFIDQLCTELERKLYIFNLNPNSDLYIAGLPSGPARENAIINRRNSLIGQIRDCKLRAQKSRVGGR